MPSLAAGLVAIAEEGSTAHLLARASSPASQLWGPTCLQLSESLYRGVPLLF
jgi:hypothetical protein